MPILKSVNFESLTQIWKEISSSKLTSNIKKEKSTKQDIEIIKKPENNHKRRIIGKKCADKNIKGPGRLKKKENKMENWEIPRTIFSMVYKSIANIKSKASKCTSGMSKY